MLSRKWRAKLKKYDYRSGVLSETDMNINILRSPKKDKTQQQQQRKKVTTSKKASPFKKSRIPKASTPPRKSPKKKEEASRHRSPSPSSSAPALQAPSAAPPVPLSSPSSALKKLSQASNTSKDAVINKPEDKQKTSSPPQSLNATKEPVTAKPKGQSAKGHETSKPFEAVAPDAKPVKGIERKRKSQDAQENTSKKTKSDKGLAHEVKQGKEELAEDITVPPTKEAVEVITIDDSTAEEKQAAEETKEKHDIEMTSPKGTDEKKASYLEGLESEKEEDEEEVSRVMAKGIEDASEEGDELEEALAVDTPKELARKEKVGAEAEEEAAGDKLKEVEPSKKGADATPSVTPATARESLEDSLSSLGSKSLRSSDDVFSEGDVEAAPSSSSATSAPKPSLRERIDRFRAIFSPAPRTASSIPRLSPPKATPASPRQRSSVTAKAPSQLLLPHRPSPPKSPSKAAAKVAPIAAAPKAPAPTAPAPASVPVPAPAIKVAPVAVSVPASVAAPSSKTGPTAAPPSIVVNPAKAAPPPAVKMVAPVPVKVPMPSKTVKVVQAQAAAPPAGVNKPNPFQKAQQQQQQHALATTSSLRAKEQQSAQPVPSTAHIELEEPDSAYSDSDDEETVRRRLQHKPWETREGLAKALEEQATVDADMIFGIPHGTVPIDEILPAETEYARAKRARPRSSSATWSRDGLKQVEIDRYNERMGIQGPGVLLPITVQDDGSGTPSRGNRLSAIAQSAISQGQVSRKPSQSATRASVSPLRPDAGSIRSGAASAQGKYPHLVAGTPKAKAGSSIAASSTTQKGSKVTKVGVTAGVGASSKHHAASKTTSKSNPFQSGAGSSLQASRLANGGAKAAVGTTDSRSKPQ